MRAVEVMSRNFVTPTLIVKYAAKLDFFIAKKRNSQEAEEARRLKQELTASGPGQQLQPIQSLEHLPYKLALARKVLESAAEEYSDEVEAVLGNLAVWRHRMFREMRTVIGGYIVTDGVKEKKLNAIESIMEKGQWAYIAQRRLLHLPKPNCRDLAFGSKALDEYLVEFYKLPGNCDISKFITFYFTAEEHVVLRKYSLYAAIADALRAKESSERLLETLRDMRSMTLV